jgi:hypothetical protein
VGFCGNCKGTSVSIQGRAFLDYLRELLFYEKGYSMDVIMCSIMVNVLVAAMYFVGLTKR